MDYEGADLQSGLKKLEEIHSRIQQRIGGKVDGPYLARGCK